MHYLILILTLVMPLFFGGFRHWVSLLICSALFILAALEISKTLFKSESKQSFPRQVKWVLVALGGFALFQGAQLLGMSPHYDPYQGMLTLLNTLALIAWVYLVSTTTRSKNELNRFVYTLLLTGTLAALFGIFGHLAPELNPFSQSNVHEVRPKGSFINANLLANYLGLMLCLAVGFLVSQLATKKQTRDLRQTVRAMFELLLSQKVIVRIALVVMIIALVITRSRMGNSAFFLALCVVGLYAFFCYKKPPINLKVVIVSFFVLDLIVIGSIFGVEKVKQRLVETSLQSETRDDVVTDSMPIIAEHGLSGTGGGSFYLAFLEAQPDFYSGFYDNAHNDYIQFAVEFGVPITLLLGCGLVFLMLYFLNTIRTDANSLTKGLHLGAGLAILFTLMHASVDYPLQAPANRYALFAIITLAILSKRLTVKKKKRARTTATL